MARQPSAHNYMASSRRAWQDTKIEPKKYKAARREGTYATDEEDDLTPRASQFNNVQPERHNRHSNSSFDELYDVTDDESVFEDVPLFASRSVKHDLYRSRRVRVHSLEIPSPSAWPTIEKLQKDGRLPDFPLSPPILSPTPRNLSKIVTNNLHSPERHSTPSLDGSMTSEELSNLSCPSTPDSGLAVKNMWGVQLQPAAMELLNGIATSVDSQEHQPRPPGQPQIEMQEKVKPTQAQPNIIIKPPNDVCDDPVSAISIPSPSCFFSSLDESSRKTWVQSSPRTVPDTSTAERFYDVPWSRTKTPPLPAMQPERTRVIIPKVISEQPIEVKDYDAKYVQGLQRSAAASFDRTSIWLSNQDEFSPSPVSAVTSTPIVSPCSSIDSPASTRSTASGRSVGSSLKSPLSSLASVDETAESIFDCIAEKPPKTERFIQGFQHVRETAKQGDAFTQRRARIESLQLDRTLLGKVHRDQLLGKYELTEPAPPKPQLFSSDEPSENKTKISRVLQERQALEQIKPVTWNLEATKLLNGGTLLTSPAGKTLFSAQEARVLDLGGQASCDWAWEVALQHPSAEVTTVYTADQSPASAAHLQGPGNHRHRVVPNLWTLPYPSDHFDIISARSLFALLRTTRPALQRTPSALDEYDLCIRECRRCLKPGGYFEFAVLDADIIKPGQQAQALGVEFGFNLKTRGYDPAPTRAFLPRLRRAGFGKIQRAWLALPMGAEGEGGEEGGKEAGYVSGMVGAWAWERWMLKLQMEMGRGEDRLLEGVAGVLEEGAKSGSSWRYLSGWARK